MPEPFPEQAQLPGDELFKSVQYDSSETFLRWLWHELYGDEPFDADSLSGLHGLE